MRCIVLRTSSSVLTHVYRVTGTSYAGIIVYFECERISGADFETLESRSVPVAYIQ